MKKKIIIANWKMNPQTLEEAQRLLDDVLHDLKGVDFSEKGSVSLLIAPPFTYLLDLKSRLPKNMGLAAQDVAPAERGAYTGEVSALMLSNIGVGHVIIGHSEKRWKLGETDEMINLKIKMALSSGLKPILAVGEKNEDDDISSVLNGQLKAALNDIDETALENVIIAYEPVWAIGTGRPDTPDGALTAALLIRKIIISLYPGFRVENLPVLYGGSVDAANISGFVKQDGIDGALVGGASLKAAEFAKMVRLVAE